MAAIAVTEKADGIEIVVKVVPGSSKTAIAGALGDMLKVKVAAAPEKGKANECLCGFLADILGVKKNSVSVVSGLTSPVKTVSIAAISRDDFFSKVNLK